MSDHRAGGKFAGSHTTVTDAAGRIVDNAKKMPEVTKIVLGMIKVIGAGPESYKFIEIGAGWKIVVRGNTTRQEVFLYTTERDKVKKALEKYLENLN